MMRRVPLGPWLPDTPSLDKPGLRVAKNVYPSAAGYYPFWSAEAGTETVSGTILGAARFERTDGTEIHVVGTTTDLYVITGGTATASSLALTSINNQENWTFEQFGLQVYATIKSIDADGRQTYYLTDIDSDTSFSAAPGSPPAGNAMAKVDDFLFIGDLEDIDSSNAPYRIRWSPFNDADGTWTTDLATQSGFVDMPGRFGPVKGIVGGERGIILQKEGASVIDYTGGATAFQKAVISENIGCESGASIATVGGISYWLSRQGIARSDGQGVELISAARVWDWFLETANTDYLNKVQAAINYDRRCIVWNFYQVDTTAYNAQLIYNYEIDSWSYALTTIDWLVPTVYTGSFSEGDPRLRKVLGGFSSGTWQELTGTAEEAVLETGDFQLEPGRRSFVTAVRPVVENSSSNTKIAIKYRDDLGDTQSSTTSTAVGGLGFLGVAVDGRYFSVETTLPAAADWDKATAVDIDAIPSGLT